MFEVVLFVVAGLLIVFGAWLAACDAALGVVSRAELQEAAVAARRGRKMLAATS